MSNNDMLSVREIEWEKNNRKSENKLKKGIRDRESEERFKWRQTEWDKTLYLKRNDKKSVNRREINIWVSSRARMHTNRLLC